MEVLGSLASGKRNKEIGRALEISEGTIKYHVKSILRKLDVIGRAEAVAVASAAGNPRISSQSGRRRIRSLVEYRGKTRGCAY